jgi:hypothetical protein
MARTVHTAAGPPPLYYLCIDGTEAQDAATFGALLEQRGWKNLATTYLKPAKDDPSRLLDPAHDFLPIPLVEAKGRRIAVVAPGGRDGKGLDSFWRRYPHHANGWGDTTVVGRYAAAELSCQFTSKLILRPQVHTHQLEPERLDRHLADEALPYDSRHAPAAKILYVSSHGYQSGVMRGDTLQEGPAVPPTTRLRYRPNNALFSVARACADGKGFQGPEWIVLAQCSTVNASTWVSWARILARSSPGVRGILAYEDSSPLAEPARRVAEQFFGYLTQGLPFLLSWSLANPSKRWAAIVHKDAVEDKLTEFAQFRPLAGVSSTGHSPNYYGYLSTSGRQPILETNPPFRLVLENQKGSDFHEIRPEDPDSPVGRFVQGTSYRLTVHAPEGDPLREVTLTVINIRASFDPQIAWDRLFEGFATDPSARIEGQSSTTLTIRMAETAREAIALKLRARDPLSAGLDQEHSFLWFRIYIRTRSDALVYDFRNVGLRV